MATDLGESPDGVAAAAGSPADVAGMRRSEPRRGGSSSSFDEPTGVRRIGRYALLVVITFIVVFPVYTTVIASLKPGDEVLVNPLLPTAFTLDVLVDAWNEGRLGRYLFNSFVVAAIVTVAVYLIPHSMAGSQLDYDAVDRGVAPEDAIGIG